VRTCMLHLRNLLQRCLLSHCICQLLALKILLPLEPVQRLARAAYTLLEVTEGPTGCTATQQTRQQHIINIRSSRLQTSADHKMALATVSAASTNLAWHCLALWHNRYWYRVESYAGKHYYTVQYMLEEPPLGTSG
jgi:hypothetical protein